jgi:hypothetical protein
MSLSALLKGFRRPKADPEAVARIKAQAAAILELPPDATLAVNEIVCTDPSCPGTETVILVMIPGQRTRACKLPMALDAVTEPDLRAALV